ncbi:MAG: serine--tRNA ligase [Candidatus Omnitrophota bacterium]
MLDIKFIRENIDLVKTALKNSARGGSAFGGKNIEIDIDRIIALDNKRRSSQAELEALLQKKNQANDEITRLLKEKKDIKEVTGSMKEISNKITELKNILKEVEPELSDLLIRIPNVPSKFVPVGDASKNRIVRTWNEPKKLKFSAQTHIELAQKLDIIDFERGAKITGSNYILYKKQGAQLERALINFMLDLHTTKHGFSEVFTPFLVNRASMFGTGQLPKLEDDMYRISDEDLFLIPTAEVPVTNIYRDEVLEEKDLPVYLTAYSACFRKEAGSYGKDTRGLIRVHQFDKVEMVKFVHPDKSYNELESLVKCAEKVLQLLDLPYRIVLLASGDLSFAASMCYDIEVYAPGIDKWLEVSSCSNFESFQARRANIKFRAVDKKIDYVHTLNGSGVALARTVIAILENYQQKGGSILIPKVLRPYMRGAKKIG